MTLEHTLSTFSSSKSSKSTREGIITVLSSAWPLSLKQIHSTLKSQQAIDVSYQATHKTLVKLVDEGVLQCVDRKYQLNLDWIGQLKKSAESLYSSYTGQNIAEVPFADAHRHDHVTYTFDTIIEYGRFLINYFFQYSNSLQKPCVFHWKNTYMPIGLSKEELEMMNALWAANKYFILVNSPSVIDRFYGDAFIKMGHGNICFRFGVPVASDSDVLVVGDYVLRMYLRSAAKKELFERYAQFRNLKEFDLDWLFAFMHQRKTEIKIQIDKDAELANQIRQETLAYFTAPPARPPPPLPSRWR